MRQSDSWSRGLWALWVLSACLTVFLWWQSFQSRCQSALTARELEARESLQELEEAFDGVVQFGFVLSQSIAPSLEQHDWNGLAAQGEPFFSLYRSGFEEPEEGAAPPWMLSQTQARADKGRATLLLPLPPGYAAGRFEPVEDSPHHYLLYGSSWPDGRRVIWALNWDYLYGPWLEKRLGNLLDAARVKWDFRVPGSFPTERIEEWHPFQASRGLGPTWVFELPPLEQDEVSALPSVRVTVGNDRFVQRLWIDHLWYLLGAGLVLGAGAVFLGLSLRARNRELDYIEAKERFLSMVGHELRTPIATLEMYLEMLREGLVADENKEREYHQVLKRESHRLKCLVENLLTAGTAENGKLVLRKTEFSLLELVKEVVAAENPAGRDVTISSYDSEFPIEADREALYGVVSNLLNNALKYSDLPVGLSLESCAKGYRFTVEDRGSGAEDYEKLFEPYFREEAKQKRGLGLGLALVRLLVEAHSGSIRGVARDGGGSVFAVELCIKS